ncbi:MAG: putative toxin-antitoxin system toxin component, PIN family [Gammaproteobacteria bacterium]
MTVIVVDTSIFVAALLGPAGASREVLRRCLRGSYQPLMGAALMNEYDAVLSRAALFKKCALTAEQREELLDAFLNVCRWTRIYYTWRPNLPDEADNHVVELAIAGGAEAIVTKNVRDFKGAELRFTGLRVVRPEGLIAE